MAALNAQSKAILTRHVEMKGRRVVTGELGISSATLSQILGDKYPASTKAIEMRILQIYGTDGKVNCPVLGSIDPSACAKHHKQAARKSPCGNPRMLRLYHACRKCDLRG